MKPEGSLPILQAANERQFRRVSASERDILGVTWQRSACKRVGFQWRWSTDNFACRLEL